MAPNQKLPPVEKQDGKRMKKEEKKETDTAVCNRTGAAGAKTQWPVPLTVAAAAADEKMMMTTD